MNRLQKMFTSLLSTVVFLAFFSSQSFAISPEENLTPTPTPQATIAATVKYDLAFPGMLPDHPLYKLKVLRNKISATLISDPMKKIEFYLLQADKGILASAMLVDKKEVKLATETALKAEHNYTIITQELYRLPSLPKASFLNKLKTAALKHQEVLSSLAKRVDKDDRKTFMTLVDFSKRNWQSIEKYKKITEEAEQEKEE